MNPTQLIQAILYLPLISAESVGGALGIYLREHPDRESSTTRFFDVRDVGGFSMVTLLLARDGPEWTLNCTYDLAVESHGATAVDWHTYGPCVRDGVLPTMGSEGCSVYEYSYNGFTILFHLTMVTEQVYSVIIKRV